MNNKEKIENLIKKSMKTAGAVAMAAAVTTLCTGCLCGGKKGCCGAKKGCSAKVEKCDAKKHCDAKKDCGAKKHCAAKKDCGAKKQ
jgi:Na+/glutamate symporter